jgi:hypothetical protein
MVRVPYFCYQRQEFSRNLKLRPAWFLDLGKSERAKIFARLD